MLPADIRNLYEAYTEIYEEVDSITDDLIEEVVEELIEECVEFGYELDEAADAVEEAAIEYLMELNPYAPAGSKEARAYQKSTTATKRGVARKAAVTAAKEKVKAKAKGAVAAAGIAGSIAKDEARRAGRAAAHAVTSTVQKKKAEVKKGVKGLLKRGLSAVAGGAGKVAQASRKVGSAASKAADRLGEEVALNEEPKGLPYGPVGKGFKKLPPGPKRNKMMKRENEYTKAAMRDRDEVYGGESVGDNRTKMGRISSALSNPRLREDLEATKLFSDKEIEAILEESEKE